MDEASQVKVFQGETAEETLTGSLLDMLRYSADLDLCFGAFNTLVFFLSQNFVFAQTLGNVNILGTPELARDYVSAGQQISEFRRLRKWLHLEESTRECITVTKKLINWCKTTAGQDLLRNLNLEQYLTRVLKMRMEDNSLFPELLNLCMNLVGAFCSGNNTNQEIFAKYMETILLKLLQDPDYYNQAAAMITMVVDENEHLSIVYSPKLVAAVGDLALSPQHGRKLGLLIMLEQLLVVEDHPVTSSQVSICKGAMVSSKLIETDGGILEEDWGGGPRMTRLEAIQAATGDGRREAKDRAVEGCEYYYKCLEILGVCARGKMPTTELLCASMLPYETCMTRMHELYNDVTLRACADSHHDFDPTARSKSSLFAFFREVFVDTNSEHILRSLRRPNNGLWTIEETVEHETNHPIAHHLVDELGRLAQTKELGPLPQGDLREYLYEQAAMFFIQYGRVVAPAKAAAEEKHLISNYFKRVAALANQASADPTCSPREIVILSQLQKCSQDYTAGIAPSGGEVEERELAQATDQRVAPPPLSGSTLAWDNFVTAAVSIVPVQMVRGTERMVGQGMLDLAMAVWSDAKDPDESGEIVSVGKYAGFLVEPMRLRIQALKHMTSRDDIPKILTILDTIRAIPYTATAYDDDKKSEAFNKFVEVVDLDCATSPDLAAVQKELVQQV